MKKLSGINKFLAIGTLFAAAGAAVGSQIPERDLETKRINYLDSGAGAGFLVSAALLGAYGLRRREEDVSNIDSHNL